MNQLPPPFSAPRLSEFRDGSLRAVREDCRPIDSLLATAGVGQPRRTLSIEELTLWAKRLARALRAEKARGKSNHRSYDLARHVRLLHEYQHVAELLKAAKQGVSRVDAT